jgi:hypothetical protein
MDKKEPFVWEEVVNEPERQKAIEDKYAAMQKEAKAAYEELQKTKRMRLLEEVAKYVIVALLFYTASAFLIEVNVVWGSWLTGIAGVMSSMAASYYFGLVRGMRGK